MNKNALFSDGTRSYVIPQEPEPGDIVKIRFRTAKDDVDEVRLSTASGIFKMHKVCSKGEFDYYEINWKIDSALFTYTFEILSGNEIHYYNRCGVSNTNVPYYEFAISPGFSTPDWAKGAVMYQIFVDRFNNGDKTNDVENREYIYIGQPCQKVEDWNAYPEAMDIRRFYGGDLKGVEDKLDYLQELGVEVIYFNPLFVSPSNHKYDIQDYDYIDPHYGEIVEDGGENLPDFENENLNATKYKKRVGDYANLDASNALFARLVD